jgi:hypothetical protein
MKSEKIDQLAIALSKAQGEMPTVPMNAVNPFLRNRYADLAEMIKVATPVLAKNGLAISQQAISNDGHVGVTTTLIHTSGQWIEDTISLPLGDEKGKSLAQVAGSIITYLRRYSYGAIVGLATDEDTDGNQPAKRHEQPETPYDGNQPANKRHEQPDAPYVAKPLPGVNLRLAESEKNAAGALYGTLDTETLVHMANTLAKMEKRTDEQERKLTAARTILKSRSSSSAA